MMTVPLDMIFLSNNYKDNLCWLRTDS